MATAAITRLGFELPLWNWSLFGCHRSLFDIFVLFLWLSDDSDGQGYARSIHSENKSQYFWSFTNCLFFFALADMKTRGVDLFSESTNTRQYTVVITVRTS